MAKFIRHDAEGEKDWVEADISTLKKMQGYVDGYIELVWLNDEDVLVVNEEGLIRGLPFNYNASYLANKPIVGDAIYCKHNEIN